MDGLDLPLVYDLDAVFSYREQAHPEGHQQITGALFLSPVIQVDFLRNLFRTED